MKLKTLFASAALLLFTAAAVPAQPNAKGYYKDVFMDSGLLLNHLTDLPAARYCDFSFETFVAYGVTAADSAMQQSVMFGNSMDENGVLLYPDGQPRFRMIYMNGGRAASHGRTLYEKGLENIRTFYKNGGSYVGTCAGMFIASKGTRKIADSIPPRDRYEYTGIWPGYCLSSGLNKSFTGMFVEENCPLLKYADFGGDMYIDSVRHNGGGYTLDSEIERSGAEVLLRYDRPDYRMHKNASTWAWKESEESGRAILCGSHPEAIASGERLHLFSAMFKYAMEGNGCPVVKGGLVLGEPRKMIKGTGENDPAYTKIGDKQYHHFTFDVPAGTEKLTVKLASQKHFEDYDLYLFAKYDGFAFSGESEYENVELGFDKELVILNPKEGKLYISVYCDTTVDTYMTSYGEQYSGRVDVLNGVPYTITVE